MAVISERDQIQVGGEAWVRFSPPRISLGRFSRTFDSLIAGAKARVREPNEYFIVEGGITRWTQPPSGLQLKYRSALSLVDLLAKSAAFLDAVQQTLVFFRDGRIEIPIDYDVGDLQALNAAHVEALAELFNDPIHQEQKLTILAEAVVDLVVGLPARSRFRQIIREIEDLREKVAAGYRLFASSFTYSKIRREIESAQADFIARVHKTFVDLQGQILGIPIATIVVASQLKPIKACGADLWTNIAILAGAWIFVLFLLASIVNQWLTLNAVSFEFGRQRERLMKDFTELQSDFDGAFRKLTRRVRWHRFMFVFVGAVGLTGAIFATLVAVRLSDIEVISCF